MQGLDFARSLQPKNFWNRLPSRESYRCGVRNSKMRSDRVPQVVIVGAGFGGLNAAQVLASAPVHITVIDRNNYHTFQPLLYQVATAGLSPGEIAEPIRSILRGRPNVEVLMAEVAGFDVDRRVVQLADSEISYDYLIVAAG